MTESKRTGRRPGNPDTRGEILAAASKAFEERGYEATTLRGVARDAGVDPALLHRFFGSKHELFVQAARLAFDPSKLIDKVIQGPRETAGQRIISYAVFAWDSPFGQSTVSMVQSNPKLVRNMVTFMAGPIVEAAMTQWGMSKREAQLRTAMIETQMMGLIVVRYAAKLEPMASLSREELVRAYAPILQHLATGDIGIRGT